MNQDVKQSKISALLELFFISTRLGFTSFGGPVAHLGYFHSEYVKRRKWMDEKTYMDLVALCQFLPGPASSQVGIGIGVMRAGVIGGIVSFLGFTMPSVIVLILFALFVQGGAVSDMGWIHGLKIVAVAVVAQAIFDMGKKVVPDLPRKAMMLAVLLVSLLSQTAYTQIVLIVIAAAIGMIIYRSPIVSVGAKIVIPISKKVSTFCLLLFFALLTLLPIARSMTSSASVAMFDSFYRSGSLVFGGGHVVLPLLEREFVQTGWLTEASFLAGYGAAQAVPGPLFTFASYVGTVMNGWGGGILATIAIFLPAFLLIVGVLPFWNTLRQNNKVSGALLGVNAAVLGILIAAFYDPIWVSTIQQPIDFAIAVILFSLLVYWKLPAWMIVLLGMTIGIIIF